MKNVTTQSIISIIIFLGGGLFLWKANASEGINSSVINLMMLCGGFYFGSSSASAKKDETINTMINNPAPPPTPVEPEVKKEETIETLTIQSTTSKDNPTKE